MKIKLVIYIAVTMLCCSAAYGVTLTFDEVQSGTVLQDSDYAYNNRVSCTSSVLITDHTGSAWGTPHSGNNVLTFTGFAYIYFGRIIPANSETDYIQSVGAYFSTDIGAMVRITAYRPTTYEFVPVTSVVIGAPGESWNNRYVEISSTPDLPFTKLRIEGVNSPNDLLGFCLDDMTITPVPEPSSLLALGAGLLPVAGMALRRRK